MQNSLSLDRGENKVWVFWISSRNGKHGLYTCHTENEGIEEENHREQDTDVKFLQNSPNPFSSEIVIQYSIAKPSYLSLKIYNASGQLVKTLADERRKPGYYAVSWNGKDNEGRKLPIGVYFLRLEAKRFTLISKVIMIR